MTQEKLALNLLDWHGGQSSGLYAVGSCMLSDVNYDLKYKPKRHHGHDKAIVRALSELRRLREDANFPECVTDQDVAECEALAKELEKYLD